MSHKLDKAITEAKRLLGMFEAIQKTPELFGGGVGMAVDCICDRLEVINEEMAMSVGRCMVLSAWQEASDE